MRRFAPLLLVLGSLVSLIAVGSLVGQQQSRGGAGGNRAVTARSMTQAADAWLASLDDAQREKVRYEFDAAERVGWHFIPKAERKGLQLRDMTDPQREAARALLRSCLSQAGYGKAQRIMAIEDLLAELEQGRGVNIRDSIRYYFTLFGDVGAEGRWGLSIEGHHLSLNFVVEGDRVVAMSPMFLGINPSVTNRSFENIRRGARILAQEELLAFELVQALDETQLAKTLIAETAPADIRAAGETQPPSEPAAGIPYAELTVVQQSRLEGLVEAYLANMPRDVAAERRREIVEAGWDEVRFCWMGALRPGIGHAYRVQGPTFLIEFNNTQADADGNPASHIHSVWRDPRGDFALPIGG
ncbi:MAG TPA: hypothetical protein DCQ98_18795 [Planctomycetaceae bacterium]|nr:hypothetical protein [Planctomycetaceae bacterium]HRE99438.1 DUF3500 domain-containing protein [Pirellulaceae bacterium]